MEGGVRAEFPEMSRNRLEPSPFAFTARDSGLLENFKF